MEVAALAIVAALALPAGALPAAGLTPSGAATLCPDDLSRPKLTAALREMGELGEDAAAIIEAYETRRQTLCREVEALTRENAALAEMVAIRERDLSLSDRLGHITQESADRWRLAYETEAARPARVKGRILDCVVGGGGGAALDGTAYVGVQVTCGISLLPR